MTPKFGVYICLMSLSPQEHVVCLKRSFALQFFSDSLSGWKLGLDLCYLSKKYKMCEACCPGHIVLILDCRKEEEDKQIFPATYIISIEVTNV